MKSCRFEHLLASTAFGLVLALSSHAGFAQQSNDGVQAAAPHDSDAAATVKQDAQTPSQTAPAAAKDEPKQETAAPVSEPAKAASAPAAPANADTQVADQLRDLITGKKLDRLIARRDDRAGVEQFYKARDYKPLWLADGKAGARAKAAAAYLGQVETVGLDAQDYPRISRRPSSSSPIRC